MLTRSARTLAAAAAFALFTPLAPGAGDALPTFMPAVLAPVGDGAGVGAGLADPLVQALRVDAAAARALPVGHRVTMLALPVAPGQRVDVTVERFEVLAPGAVLLHNNAPMPAPDVVLLRGEVAGMPGSRVFLGVSDAGTNGWIDTPAGMFVVSTVPGEGTVAYRALDVPPGVIPWNTARCGGALRAGEDGRLLISPVPGGVGGGAGGGSAGGDNVPCRVVSIAIDTDFEFAQRFNLNAQAAANYATLLVGAMSEIYRRDVNATFEIPFLRIFTTDTDPYTAGTVEGRLDELLAHWRSQQQGVDRNLAHLLTGFRGGYGGVAYLGVICNRDWGFGASGYLDGFFPNPLRNFDGQNWDPFVFSHEVGHNFAAPHTHDLTPPIDACGLGDCSQAFGGTIMSYCHTCAGGMTNIALSLHPRMSADVILPYLAGLGGGCNLVRSAPTIPMNPGPLTVAVGADASFSAMPTGRSNRFQWFRDGQLLVDGPRVSGATTRTITIAGVVAGDQGDYTVVVSNSCGQATSTPARLTVAPCRVDYNFDGEYTFDDIQLFIGAFNALRPGGGAPGADLNRDGEFSFDDIQLFVQFYNAGC